VLVSYVDGNGHEIDLFLKHELAVEFHRNLSKVIKFNKKGDIK
jgi:hypothetical protein